MRWKLLISPLVMVTGLALAQEPPAPDPDAAGAAVPSGAEAAGDASTQAREDGQDAAIGSRAEAAGLESEAQAPTEDPGKGADMRADSHKGPKMVSGMSILGNQEAPKSLVIVPWKSSEIGDSIGISTVLDDSRQPIDREVFLRELSYYEIRSEKKP